MDKKTEIQQFCKTMWIMTKYEFLPAALIVGAMVAGGWFLKTRYDKGNVKKPDSSIKIEKIDFKNMKTASFLPLFSKTKEKIY